MYKAEIEHNKSKIARGPNAIEPRPADEQLALGYDRPKELDNWAYKGMREDGGHSGVYYPRRMG